MFQSQPLVTLLIQYYTDVYHDRPIEARRGEDGEITFSDVEDPLIAKAEEALAREDFDEWERLLRSSISDETFSKLDKVYRKRHGQTFGDTAVLADREAKRLDPRYNSIYLPVDEEVDFENKKTFR